jgi:hypothetical protein
MRALVVRAGRIEGPRLISYAAMLRVVTDLTLARTLGDVWSAAEYPEESLGRAEWVGLFRQAGFTVDGERSERPAAPVRLYRGAPKSRRRRMSWTSEETIAERFAIGGLRGREPGMVWVVDAPPEAILAVVDGRHEGEHLLDTRGLRINPAGSRRVADGERPQNSRPSTAL